MSVYVDSMSPCLRSARWRYTEACHLFADDDKELVEFGCKMGLKEEWLQQGAITHFDLTFNMRVKAKKMGATEVSREFLVEEIRRRRQAVTT